MNVISKDNLWHHAFLYQLVQDSQFVIASSFQLLEEDPRPKLSDKGSIIYSEVMICWNKGQPLMFNHGSILSMVDYDTKTGSFTFRKSL